jgi:hypothetical protein
MQVRHVHKNSNIRNIQVLSHPISSQNFKFSIPSVFRIKSPLLEIKNPMLKSKIACTQIKNLVPGIKNSILRIKNHLHPNKKPCARNQKNPCLESKNRLHPNLKTLCVESKNPMLRIRKPMLRAFGGKKNLPMLMEY